MQLPIQAFRLEGVDSLIELTIDELFGFPDETSYGGGYGAKGRLTIRANEYSVVAATHYFTTGELYRFMLQLEECYETLSGTAVLENTERELELECQFNKLGHVSFSGSFQGRPDIENILTFECRSDQTQIPAIIASLKHIYSIFGGNYGIKRT